jgi:hypothetical protein
VCCINFLAGILWEAYFNIVSYQRNENTPNNIHFVDAIENEKQRIPDNISMSYYLERAKEIFEKICPNEEFMETVPHPEDIIYVLPSFYPFYPFYPFQFDCVMFYCV